MANFFGIDFGTTNSAVVAIAAVDGNKISELTIGEETFAIICCYK